MAITLLVVALLVGFYVAWNIGANDVANAMGTSVGSGALTLKSAVILAAILEFGGAFLLGSHVSETVESGVVNPLMYTAQPEVFAYGMLAALLAAGVWLQVASYFGWPVSTTHSIIGALVGFGLLTRGFHSIYWTEVLFIFSSWIISPLLGGAIAFLLFNLIRKRIFYSHRPIAEAKKLTPYLLFVIFWVLSLVLLYQDSLELHFWQAFLLAIGIAAIASLVGAVLIRRVPVPPPPTDEVQGAEVTTGLDRALRHLRRTMNTASGELREEVSTLVKHAQSLAYTTKTTQRRHYESLETEHRTVEKIFVYLQIISACFMAFAHGANDVANAIGPLSAVITFFQTGTLALGEAVPVWLLALGGTGIIIGLATWGWRVIKTVGKRITELTPTRGFAAEFGAALTILIASRLGLPISTTHTLVGAVLGVGLARGIGAINMNTIRDIVISWVITIPAGALLSILFYSLISWALS